MSTYEKLLAKCKDLAREVGSMECFDELFERAQDIEFACGAGRGYRSARLTVAIGGPGIFINTRTGMVEGRWMSDCVDVPCDTEALDDALRDYWECAA